MPKLHQLSFDGSILARGFWLYIWEITVKDGCTFHYVGKTGDKSSGVSQSPFNRLSNHLGDNTNNNALRRYLESGRIDPGTCRFSFHACGPLFLDEPKERHGDVCDRMSALEKALADAMEGAGYALINKVVSRMKPDLDIFAGVKAAFAVQFPKLLGV